jgi:hypothetical protein
LSSAWIVSSTLVSTLTSWVSAFLGDSMRRVSPHNKRRWAVIELIIECVESESWKVVHVH